MLAGSWNDKMQKIRSNHRLLESVVATISIDKKVTTPSDGFSFDIWNSGLTVAEVMDLAQDHGKIGDVHKFISCLEIKITFGTPLKL